MDRMVRNIPVLGKLYAFADKLVGLMDKRPTDEIAAMGAVWCFFGGKGVAVLALAPSADPIDIEGRDYFGVLDPDRARADRRRAALRAHGMGAPGEHRDRQADGGVRLDGHHAAEDRRARGQQTGLSVRGRLEPLLRRCCAIAAREADHSNCGCVAANGDVEVIACKLEKY